MAPCYRSVGVRSRIFSFWLLESGGSTPLWVFGCKPALDPKIQSGVEPPHSKEATPVQNSVVREQVGREGCEPVLAGVIAAGDVLECRGGMPRCGFGEDFSGRIVRRRRRGDA